MGYEIYYDRAFIKVNDDQFIAMLQHGSNNCFEFGARGQEIQEKYWSSWNYTPEGKGTLICTKEGITKYGTIFGTPSSYGDLPFKARGHQFGSPMEAMRWFWNGIKTAMTVEEYVGYENQIQVVNITEEYPKYEYITIKTTTELLDTIKVIGETKCYIRIMNRTLMRPKKSRVHREPVVVDHYFVLKCDGYYLNKMTSRRLKFTDYLSWAKKCRTEKAAILIMNKIRATYRQCEVSVERVDKETRI